MAMIMRVVSMALSILAIISLAFMPQALSGVMVWYIVPGAIIFMLLFCGIAQIIDNTKTANDLMYEQLNALKDLCDIVEGNGNDEPAKSE